MLALGIKDERLLMKKAIKASLLSALVFPGSGQLFLKQYRSALLYFVAAGVTLYYLLDSLFTRSMQIVEQLQNSQSTPSVGSITAMVAEQPVDSNAWLSLAPWMMLVIWLASIVFAFQSGREQDRRDRFTSNEN